MKPIVSEIDVFCSQNDPKGSSHSITTLYIILKTLKGATLTKYVQEFMKIRKAPEKLTISLLENLEYLKELPDLASKHWRLPVEYLNVG